MARDSVRYAIWNEFVSVDVEEVAKPRSTEDVVAIVERARRQGKHLKAVGASHSFNDLGLCEDILVDLSHMDRVLEVDRETGLVRAQAGIALHQLIERLADHGLALANVGAWTEQTLAGVLSTATHGSSGRYRKTLMGSLRELTLIDGQAQARVLSGDALEWLSLGFFGIVVEVVIQAEPMFYVRQSNVVRNGETAIRSIPEDLATHDFVDLRWAGSVEKVITRRWNIEHREPGRRDRAAHFVEGIKLNSFNVLLSGLRAEALPKNLSDRMFRGLGQAYVRGGKGLSHLAAYDEGLTFNSLGVAAPHEERELGLPMDAAVEFLLLARRTMLDDPDSAPLEIQIRFTPAVGVKLAVNGDRDTCWFNINILNPKSSARIVDRLCDLALEHGARPHWAKTIPARMPRLVELYGDIPRQWEEVRRSYDPDGHFLNDWYHRYFDFAERSLPEQDETDEG